MIHLSHAVADRILTIDEADAIESAVVDHGNGLVSLHRERLTRDQLDALDRYLRALDAECCGQ